MLKSLTVKGFQSHVASFIQLGPGLNVVTGASDSGKTAIIRAVRWVAFGEPSGEAFVNEKVGEAEVTIELENGVEITKRRRKGKTSYQLSTMDEAFEKAEVPKEVEEALRIVKQTFGDFETALNFAYQLEAPFLISETASAGAKILGKMAGTERVDMAAKAVSKDTYAARQDKAAATKDIENIERQLVEYLGLEQLRNQLEACEYLADQITKDADRLEQLKGLEVKVVDTREQVGQLNEKLTALEVVPLAADYLEDIKKTQQRYEALLGMYEGLADTSQKLKELETKLSMIGELQAPGQLLMEVKNAGNRLAALNSLSTVYTRYTQEVNSNDSMLRSLNEIEGAAAILEDLVGNRKRLLQLASLQGSYSSQVTYVGILEKKINDLNDIEEAAGLLGRVDYQTEQLQKLKDLDNLYRGRSLNFTQALQVEKTTYYNADQAEKELEDIWEGVEACPLCEQPITGGSNHGH